MRCDPSLLNSRAPRARQRDAFEGDAQWKRSARSLGARRSTGPREVGAVNSHREVRAYYGEGAGDHHRYRSWEHCYGFFRQARADGLAANCDHAALQLAFYLASWGMCGGSSFLLQYAYTAHRGVVDLVAEARFDGLWGTDFGAGEADLQLVPRVGELIVSVRQAHHEGHPRHLRMPVPGGQDGGCRRVRLSRPARQVASDARRLPQGSRPGHREGGITR